MSARGRWFVAILVVALVLPIAACAPATTAGETPEAALTTAVERTRSTSSAFTVYASMQSDPYVRMWGSGMRSGQDFEFAMTSDQDDEHSSGPTTMRIVDNEVYAWFDVGDPSWMHAGSVEGHGLLGSGGVSPVALLRLLERPESVADVGSASLGSTACRKLEATVDFTAFTLCFWGTQDTGWSIADPPPVYGISGPEAVVWVGAEDHYIRKIDLRWPTDGDDPPVHMVYTFSDFGRVVAIEAPEGAVEFEE